MVANLATQIVVTVAVAGLSASLQRLSGFGFALFSTPLLALAMPVSQAVVVVTIVAFPSGALNYLELRDHIDKAKFRRLLGWSIPGMPLGLAVHDWLPDKAMRIVLAAFIGLAAVLLITGAQVHARHAKRADAAAGFISGVLNTSTGTNGPPLVVTLAGQDLEPDVFRATLAGVFVFAGIVALFLFGIDGKFTRRVLLLGAVGVPLVFVGREIGARLSRHLPPAGFRRLVLGLLVATAVLTAIRAFV